jgi:hypothetical protein
MDSSLLDQPDFLIEDVVSFANWAFDLIPTKFYNKDFNLVWIPDWPSYYSWVLQSMWHFLLNQKSKDKKNIFLFTQKLDDKKIFILDYNKIFLGKKYRLWWLSKFNLKTTKIIKKFNIWENLEFEKTLELQLPFLRLFNDSNEIFPFFVWKKIDVNEIIKILSTVDNKESKNNWLRSDYNIFLIDNLLPSQTYDKTLEKHENYVNHILWSKKPIKNIPFSVNLFKSILKIINKKPEVVNYINSNFLSWNKGGWNGYLCFAA